MIWLQFSSNVKVIRFICFPSFLKKKINCFGFDEILMGSVMLLAVADVLTDAASVLGGDATLQILYMKLVEVCIIWLQYKLYS